jgi:hypothetical protein
MVGIGIWWRAAPDSYPFGPGDRFSDLSMVASVSPGTAAQVLLWTGSASICLAFLLLSRLHLPRWLQAVMGSWAALLAVTFAFVVPDIQLLILLAYAVTLAIPSAVAFVVVWRLARLAGRPPQVALRQAKSSAAVLFGLTVAGLVVGRPWLWGDRPPDVSLTRPALLLTFLATGLAWAAVGLRLLRRFRGTCLRCGRPGRAWTHPASAARWGRAVTIAAALTPLPYVLARLTWLTPWPYGESHEVLAANPSLWLWGLGLAAAGEVGTWLTLGLIRDRGETFPSWVPALGGRTVPVMGALIPGAAVALLMCIAGHSIVQQALAPGAAAADRALVILVPLPVWGPLLGAAVLAYWYRRRPPCRLRCSVVGGVGPVAAATQRAR